MTDQLPPLNGIARRKRSDAGILRKSKMSQFVDLFRAMTNSEQITALVVIEQIQRLGLSAAQEARDDNVDAG